MKNTGAQKINHEIRTNKNESSPRYGAQGQYIDGLRRNREGEREGRQTRTPDRSNVSISGT